MSESFPYSCLRSPCLVLDYYTLVGFSRCRYDPYVLLSVCICSVRRRLDILVCGQLVWSCISRDAWKLGVSISVLEFTRCSSVPPFIPWAIVYVSRGQFFVVPLWSLCLPRRLRLLCPAAFGNSCLRSARSASLFPPFLPWCLHLLCRRSWSIMSARCLILAGWCFGVQFCSNQHVVSLRSKSGSTVPSFIPWSIVHSSTV